jgi:hypothetical protein
MPGRGRDQFPESWRAFPVNESLQWYLAQTAPRALRPPMPALERREPPVVDDDDRDLWDYLGDFA